MTRMERDAKAAEGSSLEDLIKIDKATGLEILPHWLAQPYFRPLPAPATNRKRVLEPSTDDVRQEEKKIRVELVLPSLVPVVG